MWKGNNIKKTIKLLLLLVVCTLALTGCKSKNVEGELSDIMQDIYSDIKPEDMPMLDNFDVLETVPDNIEYYIGTKDIEYYEYYQTLDVYDWDITGDISKWSIAEFILELKLAQTQELAIIMTEVEENLYSSDALINYLNETNLEYESKIIINRLFNNNDNRYNNEIVEYFNSQDKISYEQEVALLKFLGMTVDSNGNVYW